MAERHEHVWELVVKQTEEIKRLQALNTELLTALREAREELEDAAIELTANPYDNPNMNALIERAEKSQ